MLNDIPRILKLIAVACDDAEAVLPAGTTEKKGVLYAKRLAIQLQIDHWEDPKSVAELLPRFQAAMARTGAGSASAPTAVAMRTDLADAARGLSSGAGETLCLLLDVEYDLISKAEAYYRDQLARLADRDMLGADGARQYDGQRFVDFLSGQVGGAPVSLISLRRIPGGFSKTTLILEIDAGGVYPRHVVVRLDRADSFLGTKVIDEYAVIERLHAAGVKVPRPLAQEPTGSVAGDPFIVVAAVPGMTIGDMFNLPAAPNRAVNRSVAAELAKLHSVPIAWMDGHLRNTGTTREQVAQWLADSRAAWEQLAVPSAIMDAAFAWLADNLDLAEGDPVVMHGDTGLNNILIDKDEVTALLDWEFVQAGHAAYDLGYFHCMGVALGPWDEFLASYEEAGGALPSPRTLDFFILFANIRLATMVWQAVAAFESGKYTDLMWGNPVANDIRVATMRVAEQMKAIRERASSRAVA